MCITYSCHSMARRAQFSIREGDTFESEGREAKRKIMQRASSMSRTASMNVGYLRRNEPWWIQQGGLFHFVQDHRGSSSGEYNGNCEKVEII